MDHPRREQHHRPGGADSNGDPGDELCVMKDEGGDRNFYVYTMLGDGDSTYWDAEARNPGAVARDFWIIPSGNSCAFVAAE